MKNGRKLSVCENLFSSKLQSSDRRKSSKKATPAKTNFNSSLDSSRDIKLDSEKPSANRNRLKDLGFNFDPPVSKNSENDESIIKTETRRPESRNRRSVTEMEGENVDGGRERSNSASGRPRPESGRTKVTTSKGKVETEKGYVILSVEYLICDNPVCISTS